MVRESNVAFFHQVDSVDCKITMSEKQRSLNLLAWTSMQCSIQNGGSWHLALDMLLIVPVSIFPEGYNHAEEIIKYFLGK